MRVHLENFTVDDADALAGTALDQLETGGQLDILAISTQSDSRLSVRGPDNEPLAQDVFIAQQTRAPSINDDPSLSLPILTGGHYTVDINVVTAATIQMIALYRKVGLDI